MLLGDRFARELPGLALAWQAEPAPDPRLLLLNEPLAESLDLDPEWLRSPQGVALLVGTWVPDGAQPVAQAYAGHQFGGYAPRLGDGRALLLGELEDGRDLHLKGSGRTPFSRGGDGLAAVGPMLREYVVSEAMHALGIPTTRSLAVVATGRPVRREAVLPGAVLARVASSHLRVGTFEFARATGDLDLLRSLTDHAIARHYPAAAGSLQLLEGVVAAQASLIAKWVLVGFVHGVMNTDNMTISGETIDYGPCAFLEAYDPATVFSSIDEGGRYAYGNQPAVGVWNLARLAEALLPLVHDDQDQAIALVTEVLGGFQVAYRQAWSAGMLAKLGLAPGVDAAALIDDLLALLQQSRVDYTSLFRGLSDVARGGTAPEQFEEWAGRWLAFGPDATAMDRVNPLYIPRNQLLEEALTAATSGDLTLVQQLLEVVSQPYDEIPGRSAYAQPAAPDFGTYQTFCGT